MEQNLKSILLILVLASNLTFSQKKDNAKETSLEIASLEANDTIDIKENIFGKFEKITKIEKTTLEINNKADGFIVYFSVLKYKNKTIDICPITRNYNGELDFDNIYHKFNKNLILNEDALKLLSEYYFEIQDDIISRQFTFEIDSEKFPDFLTRTTEVMRLK